MRILITGAGGMLGQDVRVAALAAGNEPISLARAQLDVADADAVLQAVTDARPDAVISCAAWTAVDAAEQHEQQATAVNGAGAGHVARAAASVGAWTIHVSSDYVFDGSKRSPYLESDPTGPLSAYGRSKLAGELAVASGAPHAHTIVRSSWLFGAGGPCFPKTMLQLAADRDELNVVDDQIGCPTFTGHLAPALVWLAESRSLGVLHVAAAEQCSWYEFAVATISAGGHDCTIHPIDTGSYPLPAPRPAFSVLRSQREAPTLPSWREGLRNFISEIALVRS
jgi:dTDP-4-dehydrorhamnose reductase